MRELGGKIYIALARYSPYDDTGLIVVDAKTGQILEERSTWSEVSSTGATAVASSELVAVQGRLFVLYYDRIFEIDPGTFSITHKITTAIYPLGKEYNGKLLVHSDWLGRVRVYDIETWAYTEHEYAEGWYLKETINGVEVTYRAGRPGVMRISPYLWASFAQGIYRSWYSAASPGDGVPLEHSADAGYVVVGDLNISDTALQRRVLYIHDTRQDKRLILPRFHRETLLLPERIVLEGHLVDQMRLYWRTGSEALQGPDVGWKPLDPEAPAIQPDHEGWQLGIWMAHVPWLRGPDGTLIPHTSGTMDSPVLKRVLFVLPAEHHTRTLEVIRTRQVEIRRV